MKYIDRNGKMIREGFYVGPSGFVYYLNFNKESLVVEDGGGLVKLTNPQNPQDFTGDLTRINGARNAVRFISGKFSEQ